MPSRGRLVEVRVNNHVSCLLLILFVLWQCWNQFKKQSLMWPLVSGLGCNAAVQISQQSCTNWQSQARHSKCSAGLFLTRYTELICSVAITYDASLFEFQLNRTGLQFVTVGFLNEQIVPQLPYCALFWNKLSLWCAQGQFGIDIDWGLDKRKMHRSSNPNRRKRTGSCPGKIKKKKNLKGVGVGGTQRGTAKNLYTKSERQTVSCRVTWAWTERANLCSRHVMVLTRNTWNIVGPRALFQPPGLQPSSPAFDDTARDFYLPHSAQTGPTPSQLVQEQCFSKFVRPRPGKFFFHKTRAWSQQIYS